MKIKKTKKVIKKTIKKQSITKDMPILEIIQTYPDTFEVFQKYGFHCIGCPSAQFENLEQGANMHGIDIENFVKDLNKAIEVKTKKKGRKK
jgi:hybrid cluster-associated redox disulfide protein